MSGFFSPIYPVISVWTYFREATKSRWWFQIFFIFTILLNLGKNFNPFWLAHIFKKGLVTSTTNLEKHLDPNGAALRKRTFAHISQKTAFGAPRPQQNREEMAWGKTSIFPSFWWQMKVWKGLGFLYPVNVYKCAGVDYWWEEWQAVLHHVILHHPLMRYQDYESSPHEDGNQGQIYNRILSVYFFLRGWFVEREPLWTVLANGHGFLGKNTGCFYLHQRFGESSSVSTAKSAIEFHESLLQSVL